MTASRFDSPEVRYGVIARTACGVGLEDCAREADVAYDTLRSWLKRGRAEHGTEHAAFAIALDDARALAVRPDEDAMTPDELARVVSMAARRGSVQAMRLRWNQLRGVAATEPDED